MTTLFLQPDQQALLEILHGTDGPVWSETLELRLDLSREEVFSIVTNLMALGVPVYFENGAESGLRIPEGPVRYRYARKPEELYELRVAVEREAESMCELHDGIGNAQKSFFPEPQLRDAPMLHTLYALGTMDLDPSTILMHFTRGGERRTCTYRGFPGIDDAENGSQSGVEILDRCFESCELSQLGHLLPQWEPFDLHFSILLSIHSVREARLHINRPRGGQTMEIDLPPECGGPFVALGEQVGCLPDMPGPDALMHQCPPDRASSDRTKADANVRAWVQEAFVKPNKVKGPHGRH